MQTQLIKTHPQDTVQGQKSIQEKTDLMVLTRRNQMQQGREHIVTLWESIRMLLTPMKCTIAIYCM